MKARSLILMFAGGAVLLASTVQPSPAEAQSRVAVRVAPRRSVVVRSYYYRPLFHDPWYRYGSPWYPYPDYYYGYRSYYDLSASLRLQVSPRDTEVFLDGYFAGTVDDFDGIFQRLNVEPGDHDLELYLPGHRIEHQKVYLQPGRTSNVKLAMRPLAAGEAEPSRPSGVSPSDVDRRPGAGQSRRPTAIRPRDGRRGDDVVAIDDTRNSDSTSGSVSMRVQPGSASILIDGEKWEGPQDDERLVVELSTGRHVIVVQKEGFRRYTTEVTVRAGNTTTLNVSLSPQ